MAGCDSFDLENRLVDFAVRIIRISEALPKSGAGRHLGGQVLRSGTAPAALYGEAQGAESRADFIHKLRSGLKELRETKIWLAMIERAELIRPASKLQAIHTEADQLVAIFVSSIKTAKRNHANGKSASEP